MLFRVWFVKTLTFALVYINTKSSMIRTKLLIVIFTLTYILSACNSEKKENTVRENDKPNIVLIFVDDMGYADVSCFGAQDYKTPNIDRIADEGIRFTNFYASQAVCSASRASLLTACYSERVSIGGALMPNAMMGLNPDETIIPEMLKQKGYVSGAFGKWHLGNQQDFLPLQQGFDEYVGLPYSNDMWPVDFDGTPMNIGGKKSNYPPLPLYRGNAVVDTIATLDDQAKLTTLYTQEAVKFIKKHKDEPFFLYMPHSMVHVPIAVSEKFKGKSGKGLFADVMMELDWSVGQIVKTLEENGLKDNTLIIFTSDNGPWLNFGNHAGSAYPLREGKGCMWEGGTRVSAAMSWPSVIPEKTVVNNIASTIDILPTLAEITGAKLPQNKIDGVSILSLLKAEKAANPREQFYYYYGGNLIGVRKGDWKLVYPHNYRSYKGVEPGKDGFPGKYGRGTVTEMELYNLVDDISETNNLASQYPDVVKELMIIGDSARKDLGDGLTKVKGNGVRIPGRVYQSQIKVDNLAFAKDITILSEKSPYYSGSGDKTLIDGMLGSLDFRDKKWLGFYGEDFEAIIDLKENTKVGSIICNFMIEESSWIFSPEKVEILVSTDGKKYKSIADIKKESAAISEDGYIINFSAKDNDLKIRYIKVRAKTIDAIPDWHMGAGEKAWIFIDEIIIK